METLFPKQRKQVSETFQHTLETFVSETVFRKLVPVTFSSACRA